MATANVTPIRPRLKRPKQGLLLRDSDDGDGFTTLDLVNGLQAVCVAIDASAGGTHDTDFVHRLAMAAKILSTMLADRVEI
jgi:hypothetical protein